MNIVETEPIIVEQELNAPVSIVWNAITHKTEMKKWYFDLSEFKPEIGFIFQFTGTGNNGENYIHQCEIIEVNPLKKLAYSWKYIGYPGKSVVTFELRPKGDQSIIQVSHQGIETFPQNSPDFARQSFEAGWDMIIRTNLVKYIEGR